MKVTGILLLLIVTMMSCGSDNSKNENSDGRNLVLGLLQVNLSDKGLGPIKELVLSDINLDMAKEGKIIFTAKCRACHRVGKRFIGPDIVGLLDRRSPEWIMNMILNPEQMIQENEQARKLLLEYSTPMSNQSITENQARKMLEYFRTIN
ncbi:MAG: cytochrome C [Flavobacteriaceae bacterium]|nr:MAG: cytochrome C [Flavobacteriaceae bacterium]